MSTMFVITFYGVIIGLIVASNIAGYYVGRWVRRRQDARKHQTITEGARH